jgi:hypothetical protein
MRRFASAPAVPAVGRLATKSEGRDTAIAAGWNLSQAL